MTLMKQREQTEITKPEKRVVLPCVNIHETDKEVILKAEMPGLTREEVELELKGNELTIIGKRHEEEVPKGYTTLLKERRLLEYRRTFILNDVQADKMNAKYENGVLVLTLPKLEKMVPKKIPIS